jgi:hypothetical protein
MRLAFGGHDSSSFAKIGRALNGAGPYAAQFELSGRYLQETTKNASIRQI